MFLCKHHLAVTNKRLAMLHIRLFTQSAYASLLVSHKHNANPSSGWNRVPTTINHTTPHAHFTPTGSSHLRRQYKQSNPSNNGCKDLSSSFRTCDCRAACTACTLGMPSPYKSMKICKLPATIQLSPSLLLILLLKEAGQAAAQSLSTQVATEACIHHAC